ncbi:MAG: hypothetical protein HN350_03700 [Phycisphaerales bacterium]|jgi:pimeloyl-ACP methyl ester carboxylesterase|nr:hypothetical protein [Phycisphaerales bacterium]
MLRSLLPCISALSLVIFCGCENNSAFMTPERLNSGLIVILPGIEGESGANHDIRDGLVNSGVDRSPQIWHWGRPVPGLGMILNQMDFLGNHLEGGKIAQRIVKYQDEHPGRPVHIIGHSGGGGIAVFAASQMPKGRQVTGLVLLSASISSTYDISRALKNCSSGIVNFYNRDDGALLGLGTAVLGNVGGSRASSAGLSGFTIPDSDDASTRLAYKKLYQVSMTGSMTSGAIAHFAATQPHFISRYVTPWITNSNWPADPSIITQRAQDAGLDVLVLKNGQLQEPQ